MTTIIPIRQIDLDFHTHDSIDDTGKDFTPAGGVLDRFERDMTGSTGCISHPLFPHLGLIGLQWARRVVKGVGGRLLPQPSLTPANTQKRRVQFILPVLPGYQILEVA